MGFKKRIVVVEENEYQRSCHQIVLSSVEDYLLVNTYPNIKEAIGCLNQDKPDLVLTEINFKNGLDGIEGIKIMKAKNPLVQVVVLTEILQAELIFNSLRAGAIGYLTKDSSYIEICMHLGHFFKGGAPISPKVSRILIENFHSNPNSPLTQRERDVLSLAAEGYSYEEVSSRLFIAKETAKSHMKKVFSKLSVNSKSDAIKIARENKFI